MNWKKLILWVLGIFLLVIVAGYFLVTGRAFHRYVLSKAIQEAQKATGARVEIKDFSFHLSGPSVDIYHLVLHGSEPPGEPPLFAADHIFVGLEWRSILLRKIHLARLVLDRPVIRLVVDKEGHSNLPHPVSAKRHPSASHHTVLQDVFALAVRHFQVSHGQFYFHDRPASFAADLQDFVAEAQFAPATEQYDGAISYRQGAVQYKHWETIHHGLSLQYVAGSAGLTINELALSTGSSRVSLRGNLQDYAHPVFRGNYAAVVDMQDLRRIFRNSTLPTGKVQSRGSLIFAHVAGRPWLQGLTAQGNFQSSELVEDLPEFRSPVRSIRGEYRLAGGNLEARDLHASLLAGQTSASLSIHDLPGTPQFLVQGSFRDLALGALTMALKKIAPRSLPISGSVEGKFKVNWRGQFEDLRVQSDFATTASALAVATAGAPEISIPVQGRGHLEYQGAGGTLTLDQAYFQTPYSSIRLNGLLGEHSKLQVIAHTRDLHEADLLLAALLRSPSPAGAGSSKFTSLGLKGSASFVGSVEGAFESPQLLGTLTAKDFEVHGSRWKSLRAEGSVDASAAVLQNGLLTGPRGQGQVEFEGRAQLTNWAYEKQNPISAQVTVTKLPLDTIQQLTGGNYPAKGLLAAEASFQGTPDHPDLNGQISIDQLQLGKQPIQSLHVDFTTQNGSIEARLQLRAEAGAATGNFLYRLADRTYDLHVAAEKVQLSKFAALRARHLALSGELNVSVTGSGTWSQPKLQLTAQAPRLEFQQQSFQDVTLQAEVLNRQAHLTLTAASVGLEATGTLGLAGNYPVNLSLRTGKLALSPFLARYLESAPAGLSGEAEVTGWLKGPLRQPAQLEGQIDIPSLSLDYQSLQLKNQTPLHLTYTDGVLALRAAELAGNDTQIQVHATIPLRGSTPLDVAVHGEVNLQMLSIFDSGIKAAGQLKLDVDGRGSWQQPRWEGGIEIANASFLMNQAPLGLENANARLTIQKNRLTIDQFSAGAGGGQLTASGFISFQPHLALDVGVQAKSVRVRYPQGVRSVLDGNLDLAGTLAEPQLTGRVLINRLSLTNQFDLSTFFSQFSGPTLAVVNPGFAGRLRLDLRIQSTQELSLASSKLSLQGSANLRASGTAANPIIVGRAVVQGGEVYFLGQRYTIQRGAVDFTNPTRTAPVFNLLATTTVDQYDLSINLVGPLNRLHTRYTSNPPLPTADIINLLAFGKTEEAAAASSQAPSTLGAESLLAQGVTSQLTSQVEKLVGLSRLQIDPLLGGSQGNPGARIAVQQRIAGNLLLTYATNIGSTQDQLIQIEYQVTPGVSISITRDEYGGIAADCRFHKSF